MDFEAFYGVAGLGRQERLDAIKTDNPYSFSCKTRTVDGCWFLSLA